MGEYLVREAGRGFVADTEEQGAARMVAALSHQAVAQFVGAGLALTRGHSHQGHARLRGFLQPVHEMAYVARVRVEICWIRDGDLLLAPRTPTPLNRQHHHLLERLLSQHLHTHARSHTIQ